MIEPEPLEFLDGNYVRFRGRKLLYFSGCDYFRLSRNRTLLAEAKATLSKYGLNVAASRITTGNHPLYSKLENQLRSFFQSSDALLVGSGYMTNLIVAQALAGSFSHVLIDQRAHASLLDAAQFFSCPVLRFRHRDPDDASRAVRRCGKGSKIILLTDGMFAHDSSAAPLREYLAALPHDALLLVDDAHGAGVLGENGRGTLEYAGVSRNRVIQTIALSKAFGASGGAILASRSLRKQLVQHSRIFSGHTPLPFPLAGAAIASLRLLRRDKTRRRRLFRNARWLKSRLKAAGFRSETLQTPGPVISLPVGSARQLARLERSFLRAGIFPPITRYPGLSAKGSIRCVVSSDHTEHELHKLLAILVRPP